MTKPEFSALLRHPKTPELLSRLVEANRKLDADLQAEADQRRHDYNKAQLTKYLRSDWLVK